MDSKVASLESQKGSEVANCKSIEVAQWGFPSFIQGWGMQGESKISSFSF